jgi:hypothetical protein
VCNKSNYPSKLVYSHSNSDNSKNNYDDDDNNSNNNSILIYLRTNLTAKKPLTKLARVGRTKQLKNKIRNKAVYVVIVVIIIPLSINNNNNNSSLTAQ